MLKKLRIKFVLVSVISVSVMVFSIVGFININNYVNINERSDNLLNSLLENDGRFPEKPDKEKPGISPDAEFSTRFFTIKLDDKNNIVNINTDKIFAVDGEIAKEYVNQVIDQGKETGYINDYKYKLKTDEQGTLIVFLDNSHELNLFRSVRNTSILYSIIGVLGFLVLLLVLSKRVIKPIAEAYEKQKQFITDASHELKTPLTIINSSTDIIEANNGKDKWTQKVKNQVRKMSGLIDDLISLSRLDEDTYKFEKVKINFSQVVKEVANDFTTAGDFNIKIESDIYIYGSKDDLRKLLGILFDNAVKYNANNQSISINLYKKSKKIYFIINNYAEGLEKRNYDELFERFYRLDNSRNSQTGGHGIGLSIANAIVEKHRGKIKAYSEDQKQMTFEIIL